MRSGLKRRLIAGFGANGFSRGSLVLIQIVSVPIFLSHWGTQLYGEWLLLNAIPTYFGLSDIGFGSVAGNEMTMLTAAGRQDEALTVFESVWVLITALSSLTAAALIGAIWFLPIEKWLHLHILSPHDVRLIILILGFSILFGLQEILFQAAFRCVGKYALGTLARSFVISGSLLAVVLGVVAGAGPVTAAVLYMLTNVAGVVALWFLLKREVPWIRFGAKHAEWRTIRRLASPAFSFMGFPMATALNLQGVLIVIGNVLGPVAVVTFSTARYISRSAAQAMNMVNNSVWPEMSAAFGAGDMEMARKLHRRSCQLALVMCLLIVAAVLVLGDWIWKIWTMSRVPTDAVLLDIMLLQMLVSAFWFTSSVVPMAINKHQRMVRAMLLASCFALALAWELMRVPSLGLRGAALALTLGDLFTAIYVLRESLRMLDDNLRGFLGSLVDFSLLRRLITRPLATVNQK